MIDYEKYNQWVESQRKERLLVIYKDGSKTLEELKDLAKNLKGYYFISDEQDLPMTICGLRVGGIIIEDNADFKYRNFRYALSRLHTPDEFLIFMMDDTHKERLGDILEEMVENSTDRNHLDNFIEKITFCKEPR